MPADRPAVDSIPEWLTKIAFFGVLVLVLVRLTITEHLREVFDLGPVGSQGPGATAILLLNVACTLPALLVLLRRAIDRSYVLQNRWSHLPLALLCGWVALSCLWASDAFAAVVSASTWCAAAFLGWAMSQLVRSWFRVRLVVAMVVGGLMILLTQVGLYYFYEAPDLVREWDATERKRTFEAQGWTEDNPIAIQFDRRVRNGEVLGFYRSPNTVAAVALFGAIVATALALQRRSDGREPLLVYTPALIAACAVPVLLITSSRAAQGLAVIALGLAAMAYVFRKTLVGHRKGVLVGGVIVFLIGTLLAIGIGLATDGLLHDSLTFRWRYWVGSVALLRTQPLLGVGWENFGPAYLAHRLPLAVEEIKDPHNFLVKFATETGLVGLILLLAWLGLTANELSRRWRPRGRAVKPGQALRPISVIVITYALLQFITRGDALLTNPIEWLKLALFGAVLGGGLLLTSVRSAESFYFDTGRARWLAGGLVLALLMFLAHNLVDFALFETGPMLLFFAVLGTGLGVATFRRPGRRNTPLALTALVAVSIAVLAFVLMIVWPVTQAERHAGEARQLLAKNLPERAVAEYRTAFATAPVRNSDYMRRAAEAYRQSIGMRPAELLGLYTQAITADPLNVGNWIDRVRARRSFPEGSDDVRRTAIDQDYQTIITLDPANTAIRVEYGGYLEETGLADRAIEQYRTALWYNDQLPEGEIRKLPEKTADELRQRIDRFQSATQTAP